MVSSFTRGLAATALMFIIIGAVYSQQGDQNPIAQTKAKLTWVGIPSEGGMRGCVVSRAKIPGGWLVTTSFLEIRGVNGAAGGNGITFVPDPSHQWDGGSLK